MSSTLMERVSSRTRYIMQEISSRTRYLIQEISNYIENSCCDINGSMIIVLLTITVIFIVFFGFLLTTTTISTTDENHCLKYYPCKSKKPHTMCKFPLEKAGTACNRLDNYGISEDEKNEILTSHNDYRKIIADELRQKSIEKSVEINIPSIKWDNNLAQIAQRWAMQCEFKHDECRNTEIFRSDQNLAIKTDLNGYEKSFGPPIKGWNDEFANKTLEDTLKANFVLDTAHFTQKGWSQRTHVGCGVARFFDNKYYRTYLVCNYGRARNNTNHSVSNTFEAATYVPFLEVIIKMLKYIDNMPCFKNKISLNNMSNKTIIYITIGIASVIIIIGILFAFFLSSEDYCLKYKPCDNGELHTMCKFPTMEAGPACYRLDSYDLTKKEKQDILDAHNKFRAIVASGKESRGQGGPQPAGIIPPLKWDNELALVAQRWAMQCDFNHDKCRHIERYHVGQNLAIRGVSSGYEKDVANGVKDWYDEVEFYNPQHVQKLNFAKETGHYTQLVWGKTTHVGCGIAKYYDKKYYQVYLVCNYGPAGNIRGMPVYET
ncbi:uncharacterized protein LOC122849393 [Aphidius gifuensis]|uniref:uncharacterized protein LOC122849393 n=1 Tax=Aphidius gifuensis TaxID=684658 RepID=UPI001CDD6558|nr:uncharacterized protein LOC122849393 [Aphidius gifuensis]